MNNRLHTLMLCTTNGCSSCVFQFGSIIRHLAAVARSQPAGDRAVMQIRNCFSAATDSCTSDVSEGPYTTIGVRNRIPSFIPILVSPRRCCRIIRFAQLCRTTARLLRHARSSPAPFGTARRGRLLFRHCPLLMRPTK